MHHDARGEFCEGRAPVVGVWATVVGVLHVTSRSKFKIGGPKSENLFKAIEIENEPPITKPKDLNFSKFQRTVKADSILSGIPEYYMTLRHLTGATYERQWGMRRRIGHDDLPALIGPRPTE